PCFISQTYLYELQPNISTPIVSLMAALLAKIVAAFHRRKVPKRPAFGDRSSRATRGRGYPVGLHRTAVAVSANGEFRCCGADSCPVGPHAAFGVGLCQARACRVVLKPLGVISVVDSVQLYPVCSNSDISAPLIPVKR